jgi:hypothetical protein
MNDDELIEGLGEALTSDTPASPPQERIDAFRQLVVEARDEAATTAVAAVSGPAERGGSESADVVRLRRTTGRRTVWVAAAAAAVAFVVGAVGAIAVRNGGDSEGIVEYAGPITAASGATGELSVVKTGIGRVVSLDTTDLAILPTGEYYEIWFVAPDDSPGAPDRISAGTFHPDAEGRSDVTFAAAVDPALYPVVEVTAEPGDGDPAVGGPVVLRVTIR